MARQKILLDKAQLEAAVKKIEGGKTPPKNVFQLYSLVSKELLSQGASNATPSAVKGRIEDYNIPTMTKPSRKYKKAPRVLPKPANLYTGTMKLVEEHASPPIEEKDQAEGFDLKPFTRRGVKVETLADMLTSPLKDDATNRAIMAAITEVRESHGLPALSLDEFRRLKKEGD